MCLLFLCESDMGFESGLCLCCGVCEWEETKKGEEAEMQGAAAVCSPTNIHAEHGREPAHPHLDCTRTQRCSS